MCEGVRHEGVQGERQRCQEEVGPFEEGHVDELPTPLDCGQHADNLVLPGLLSIIHSDCVIGHLNNEETSEDNFYRFPLS